MARVLVPLADGVEELEAVTLIDVLRRAKWEVVSAGLAGPSVRASRGVVLVPDADWHAVDPMTFDVLAIPGGAAGADALSRDEGVLEAVRCFAESGRLLAAICAGPLVLQAAGVLDGRRATCHPGVASRLTVTARLPERVVTDGNIVTSQGPGTAMELARALIARGDGADAARAVAEGLVLAPGVTW